MTARPSRPERLIALAACLAIASGATQALAAGERPARDFAVRAGTVLTMDGTVHSPGTVVIRDGRFTAVGDARIQVPRGLEVVEAPDAVLMPGFIEAHGERGLDGTFEPRPDASFVRITDAINPASLAIADARRNGITTLLVAPSNRAFVGGRAAIVHPQGISVEGMIVKQDAALKISLQPQPGTSRMAHVARLRRMLDDAKRAMEAREEKVEEGEIDPEEDDPKATREAMFALLAGELPAMIYAPTAADVSTAFQLAREHGFRVIPVIGPAAWRAAELLRINNVDVAIGPEIDHWETQPDGTLRHVNLAKALSDAGVRYSLVTDPSAIGAQHPWYLAARAVRAGVPREEALAAITKNPARLLGFGRSKGVIAPGSDADFLLLSADPLSGRAWVEEAYVKGARIYERDSDELLERLLTHVSEPPMAMPEIDHEEEDEHADDPEPGSVEEELHRRWPVPQGTNR